MAGVSDDWCSCLRWEGEGTESGFRVVGCIDNNHSRESNLVIFVIDGGITLKPVFLPELQFSLFSFTLFVCNRMTFSQT